MKLLPQVHKVVVSITVLSLYTPEISSFRILCLFAQSSRSHQIVFRPITDALIDKGHHLVIASTYPSEVHHPNVSYIDWSRVNQLWKGIQIGEKGRSILRSLKEIAGASEKILDIELSHPEIRNIINEGDRNHFDLVLSENHSPAFYAFAKIVKAPLVVICSADPFAEHQSVGNVVNSVTTPHRIHPYMVPLSFKERLIVVTTDWLLFRAGSFLFDFSDTLTKHLGTYYQGIPDLMRQIDILLINSHPLLSTVRPITPNTITLGFIHVQEPKQLHFDLQHFMDTSRHGVIYCSFGTNLQPSVMKPDRIENLMVAFRMLPFDVLFKYDGHNITNPPKNVKILNWLPQNDLLAHKSVKLFITHAGQHSIEEAIMREVPLLALPVQGDQPVNAKRIASLEIGNWLKFETFTAQMLVDMVHEIAGNRSYKKNIRDIKELVLDQPMTSLDKAVWWIEFVARHKGAKHLKYKGVDVPFYQVYHIDVLSFYVVLLLLTVLLIRITIRLSIRLISVFLTKVTKKNKDD